MKKIVLLLTCLLFCGSQEIKAQPRNANTETKQQQAVNSPSPVLRQSPVNDAAEAASEAYRKERDAKDDVFRDEEVRQGRIVSTATERIFWATAFYVFVTAIYAAFAFLTLKQIKKQATNTGEQLEAMKKQSRTMRGTWQVMRRQTEAVEKQLEAINKQEAHLSAQVEAAKEAADMAKGQLVAMQSQERAQYQALEAAKGQLDAMKAQAKTMDQSLVFGTRAYLGIQSVNLDIASKRLFLYIENVGKVPAKDVMVVTEIKAEVPETKYQSFCSQQPQIQHWGQREGERRLQIPFLDRLGRTKVFPGSLRIPVMIRLDESPYMSDQQFSLITGGYAKFTMRGLITYSDGFHSGKRTEFAFRYFGKNNLWVPEVIEGPQIQTDPEKPDSDYSPN